MDAYLQRNLDKREQQGLLRSRRVVSHNTDGVIQSYDQHFLDFASNDYLGLRSHPQVLQAWVNGLARYGAGSGASPLVNGYYDAHEQLEQAIADGLGFEAAILFSSGFAANQALCRALFAQGGRLFADKLMHASFIDGAMASKARFKRFAHNDIESLRQQLKRSHKSDDNQNLPLVVATEGVFSMDGDTPPVSDLVELTQEFGCTLMFDEAHAFGVLGNDGMGTISQHGLSQAQAPIVMGTFGKAFGTAGAFIAGSQLLIDFLLNFARDYVYSTATSPAQAVATYAALQLVKQGDLTVALRDNIQYFRAKAEQARIPLMQSTSAIQLVPVGCPKQTLINAKALSERGLWVGAMRTPTVPVNTDRLRITLRANHSKADIDALIDGLVLVGAGNGAEA